MVYGVVFELAYKSFALAVTFWVADYLSSSYVEALIEFTRAYITVIDLLYSQEQRPVRI